ncbi:MAG: NF038122 family metalloprotease [Terriglobia bacterium]
MFRSKYLFCAICALLEASGAPVFGGLIITPTFDSSITSDPNSANIKATINTVIDQYESAFLDPIKVYIRFQEMSSGLGQSNFLLYTSSYLSFRSSLQADATTADDATALAHLPGGSTNPVTSATDILIKSANAKALGLSPIADGVSDGTISFNASLTNPGAPGTTGQYSLMSVLEHEIDEILGLGSTLGVETTPPYSNQPSPEDFFRYRSPGVRSFTTDSRESAYFSIDGTTSLSPFDNSGSGDYGDWMKGDTAQVQDSFGTPGANPPLGVELRALDVIGYNFNAVPEPASILLFASGMGALIVVRRKRRF